MSSKLKIENRSNYKYDIFDISGEIVFDEVKRAASFIKKHTMEDSKGIIFNFEKLLFIQSSAISPIIELVEEYSAKGIVVYLMNVNQNVSQILENNSVKMFFKIIPNEKVFMDREKNKELDEMLEI